MVEAFEDAPAPDTNCTNSKTSTTKFKGEVDD